jgi:hypothetical protein
VKILFLDCDGVLNCAASWPHNSPTNTPLDPDKVARLNRVVQATGAIIVISSTWRHLNSGLPLVGVVLAEGEDCRDILRRGGVTGVFHTDWKTGYGKMSGKRGHEIEDWLEDHPEITTYAIVDDNRDMLTWQEKFLVQTTFDRGLQDSHVEALIKILGEKHD